LSVPVSASRRTAKKRGDALCPFPLSWIKAAAGRDV
jgi:hypothetical protein